jgi:hypothetical protein
MKKLIILLLSISIYSNALAQNQKKVGITEKDLFNKVANLDSLL